LSNQFVNARDQQNVIPELTSLPTGSFFRFMAADDDRVVLGSRQGADKHIKLFHGGLSDTIASTNTYWIDLKPIS
jgi:hypothetical protein